MADAGSLCPVLPGTTGAPARALRQLPHLLLLLLLPLPWDSRGVLAAHRSPINGVACNHPPYWTVGPDVYVVEDSGWYTLAGRRWGPMVHDGQPTIAGNQPGYPGGCPLDLRNPNAICVCAPGSPATFCDPLNPQGTFCPVFGNSHACQCRQNLRFDNLRATPAGIVCDLALTVCWPQRTTPFCEDPNFHRCDEPDGVTRWGVDLVFRPCPCRFGTVVVCATLCDDGWATGNGPLGIPNGCDDDDCAPEQCFTIHVEQVNDCPTWDPVNIATVEDDVVCRRFARNIDPGCWGEGPAAQHEQDLYFKWSCTNSDLFDKYPQVVYKSGDANADLCYTPSRDRSGCSTCTFTLYDSGGVANGGCDQSPPKTVQICIEEINDPPTFVPGPTTITVDEDASNSCNPSGCTTSVWSYTNWASTRKIGPGWEVCAETGTCCQESACGNRQVLTRFDLAFVDPCYRELFAQPPAIDVNTGDLTFTLAQHANTVGFRKVDLMVTLHDSGIDSGACLQVNDVACHQSHSQPVALSIVIQPENDLPSFVPSTGVLAMIEDQVLPSMSWATNMCIGGWAAGSCADATCRSGPAATCPQNSPAGCCTPATAPCPCEYCNEQSAPESQQFVWAVTTDNPGLFTTAGQPRIDNTGELFFTLARDRNGVARIVATIKDDGGVYDEPAVGNTAELIVQVEPKNDQPVFQIPPSHSMVKCNPCTPQVVAGFASGIDSGSDWTDEDVQTLVWTTNPPTVNNNNPGLFDEQPTFKWSGDWKTSDLHFTPKAGVSGTAVVTVTLKDSGTEEECTNTPDGRCDPCNGGAAKPRAQSCNRLTKTFTLTIGDVNLPPTFTIVHPGTNVVVLEDPVPSPVVIAPFSTHSAGSTQEDTTQAVTYIVTPADPRLFTATGQPAVDAQGRLTFEPAAHANGKTTLTIKVVDNGAPPLESAEQVIDLTILPVNDPPSFTHPPSLPPPPSAAHQECVNDAGCPVSVVFATGIAMGPANEASQTPLSWAVNCPSHPGLFTNAVFDTATGELSFVLQKGQNTQSAGPAGASCTVTLQDNGGRDSGGKDTFTAPFLLSVLPDASPPAFSVRGSGAMKEDDPPATFRQVLVDIASSTQPLTATCGAASRLVQRCSVDTRTGDITIAVHAELSGQEDVAVSLCNPGGCTAAVFPLTVVPVNDAPTFTPIADIKVLDAPGVPSATIPPALEVLDLGDGTHLYRIQATTGTAGPRAADGTQTETDQDLTYLVEFADAGDGVLTSPPRIDSTGILTFTTKSVGVREIRVRVRDSGGRLNNGQDTSAERRFTIDVGHFNTAPTFQLLKRTITLAEGDADAVHTEAGVVGSVAKGFFTAEESGQKLSADVSCAGGTPPSACADLFTGAASLDPTTAALSLPMAANRFTPPGGCACTLVLQDDGPQGPPTGHRHRSAVESFTLIVTSVNDKPTFVAGPDQVTTMNQTLVVPGWIDTARLSPGPFEDAQRSSLVFVAKPQDATLLAQVSIDAATGEMTVVPATGRVGRTLVDLCLRDGAGGETCQDGAFAVTVLPAGIVGVPSFVAAGPVTVTEDSAPYSAVWATQLATGDPSDASRTLHGFTLRVSGGAELFAAGGMPQMGLDGRLTFTLAKDMHGRASVDVVLTETSGAAAPPRQLIIDVTPVDDPPFFTAGPDVTIDEDAPGGYDAAWCRSLSAGAANEPLSDLTFTLTPRDPTLFATPPSLRVAGTSCVLSFVPVPEAYGDTVVAVTLADLSHTTVPVEFLLTVSPVNDAPSWTLAATTVHVVEDFGSTRRSVGGALFAGPREAGQGLSVRTRVLEGGELFAVPPTVEVSGASADLLLSSRPDLYGAAILELTLADDGGTARGGVDAAAPVQLTVVVRPENDAPTFATASANVTVFEDTPLNVPMWLQGLSPGPNEAAQRVRAEIVAGGGLLAAAQTKVDAAGTLSITPTADAHGVVTAMVRATDHDDANTAHHSLAREEEFTVTIVPVNDPPSFTLTAARVDAKSGEPFAAKVLQDVSSGPVNEAGQTVSMVVTAANPSLFASPPTISSPQGVLAFTAASAGETTLTLQAKDNGGTANGGLDASATSTIAVVVTTSVRPDFKLKEAGATIANGGHVLDIVESTSNVKGTPTYNVAFAGTKGVLLFEEMPTVDAAGTLRVTTRGMVNGTSTLRLTLTDSATNLTSPPHEFTVNVFSQDATRLQLVTFFPPAEVSVGQWKETIASQLGVPLSAVTIEGIRPDDTGKTGGAGASVTVELDYAAAESGARALLEAAGDPTHATSKTLRLYDQGVSACIIVTGDRCFGTAPCSAHKTQPACTDAACLWDAALAACQPASCTPLGKPECDAYAYCTWDNSVCRRSCVGLLEQPCISNPRCRWTNNSCSAGVGTVVTDSGGDDGLPSWVVPVAATGALLAVAGLLAWILHRYRRNQAEHNNAKQLEADHSSTGASSEVQSQPQAQPQANPIAQAFPQQSFPQPQSPASYGENQAFYGAQI
eukprot:Rhum_TRINITY_DN11710_c0_g1::Rhum_TRINITY_DN11710_c0_g1_i1::g.46560::m.46560